MSKEEKRMAMDTGRHPNVILIMADDMGYGDLSCINGGINDTPHLDRMYEGSLRLSQAYAASPVCAPSRAGFMTGRYPARTGCTDLNAINGLNLLHTDEVTIADIFKAAGYQTGLVGKWHLGTESGYRPENRGFMDVEAFHPQQQNYWHWTIDQNGMEIRSEGRYLTDFMTERAVNFIRHNREKPFFLHLAYYAPHRPLQAPESLVEKYRNSGKGLTEGQARVYAMIEVMDEGIGQINRALVESDIWEDTIVVFTSDNGPDDVEVNGLSPARFNFNLKGHKYSVHEGGIRIPFLIQWPNGMEAGDCESVFHFVDVLPTIAEACKVAIPAELHFDGESRLSVLRPNEANSEITRYWQWNRYYPVDSCNLAIRDGDWKLVIPAKAGYRKMSLENERMVLGEIPFEVSPPERGRDIGSPGAPQLFYLKDDPTESHDLAHTYPDRVREMSDRASGWFLETRDELDQILSLRFPE